MVKCSYIDRVVHTRCRSLSQDHYPIGTDINLGVAIRFQCLNNEVFVHKYKSIPRLHSNSGL